LNTDFEFMTLLVLLVVLIVAAVALGAWSDPLRAPSLDHRRDLDMRRSLWR
jgi:hypothetical protein